MKNITSPNLPPPPILRIRTDDVVICGEKSYLLCEGLRNHRRNVVVNIVSTLSSEPDKTVGETDPDSL